MTNAPPAPLVRNHLALALDIDDFVEALRLARLLQPWFGTAKVGLELFSASGPEVVGALKDLGFDVFVDLKLHDIPNTVGRAARVLGSLGVDYLTLHAIGGPLMLRAGVEGLADGAERAGLRTPTALAVTVLTSDGDAPPHIFPKRMAAALEAGCGGVVCAAADAHDARMFAPRFTIVCPGIRPEGMPHHDQARAATPRAALAAGADLLVIGRPVTQDPDPTGAAEALTAELSANSES